ncbi:unnamed protein product [Rotaria sp. Silwood1]|nr:unnamed protein product [Rotaria sp. Silwood1]
MDKTQTTLDKIWNKSQGATSTRHISSLVDHEIEMILTVSSSSSTASSSATNPLSSCTNSPSSSTTIPSSSSMTSSSSATNLFSSCNNSPSSSTTTPSSSSSSIISLPSSPILTAETENALTENINKNSSNKPIRLLSNDCTLLTGNKDVEKKDSKSIRTKHRVQFVADDDEVMDDEDGIVVDDEGELVHDESGFVADDEAVDEEDDTVKIISIS